MVRGPEEVLLGGWVRQVGKGEKACSGGEDGFYTGKEVCGIVQTGFMWIIHMCITHRLCVSLEVVLEGGRGIVGPDM